MANGKGVAVPIQDKILQPYQTISAAAQITGVPERELRRGYKDGTVPHIRSRGVCYVDIPALWDQMDEERQAVN